MDELIKYLNMPGGQGDQLGLWELLLSLSLCLICMLFVSIIYRYTHKSPSYSQSFVQTLVMMGLITTLIMIVIGSNIARAFSLVGALSIIRFRNAVKETRDVGFIFFAMAIAMACGTRFYTLALLATAFIGTVLLAMYIVNFGQSKNRPERLLRVQMPPGSDAETTLLPVLEDLFDRYSFISVENVRQGLYLQVSLSVCLKSNVTAHQIFESIAKVNDNLKISFNYDNHLDDL